MGKFKNYDQMFKHGADTDLQPGDLALARNIKRWDIPVKQHPQIDVQYAVYTAPDHIDWQRFRVNLKGCSTPIKLFRLAIWLTQHLNDLNKIRVDNYISALQRGGQLNANLEVVK